MRFKKLCPTHTTYSAKRAPRSKCPTCLAAYQRKNWIYDVVRNAASELSQKLDIDVTLEARFDVETAAGSGVRVEIHKL